MPPKKDKTLTQDLQKDLKKKQLAKAPKSVREIKKADVEDKTLTQALQKDLKKKQLAKVPKSVRDIKKADVEDQAIRRFFKELRDVPDENVADEVKHFARDPKGAWGRQKFFDTFLDTLPPDHYKLFAEGYITQESQNLEKKEKKTPVLLNLEEFWESYINRPSVAVDIRNMVDARNEEFDQQQEVEDRKEREQKRLQKVQEDMFGKPAKRVRPVEIPKDLPFPQVPKPKRARVIDMDEAGKVTELSEVPAARPKSTVFYPEEDIECINQYTSLQWVGAKVNRVYIATVAGTDISPYIAAGGEQRTEKGITWSQAGREFIALMCNNFAKSRNQEGIILTSYTRKGAPVRLHVAYDTNRGFIIQDEKLFAAEQAYLQERRQTREEQIAKLLEEPPNEEVIQYCIAELSKALHKVAPNVSDYEYNTAYILKIADTILANSTTIEQFATGIGNLVAYLEPTLGGPNVFIGRVQGEYYLPEILATLTSQDKLPEYFDNPEFPANKLEQVMFTIDTRVKRFVANVGRMLYRSRNPAAREPTRFTTGALHMPKVEVWKQECVNRKDVDGIPEKEVVYYRHNDSVYCLSLRQMLKDLNNNKVPTVPGTTIPLSDTFLRNLSHRKYGAGQGADTYQEIPSTQQTLIKELAPGLLSLIRKNITECEGEIAEDKLDDEGKCPVMHDEEDEDTITVKNTWDEPDEESNDEPDEPGLDEEETTDEETTTDEEDETTTDEDTEDEEEEEIHEETGTKGGSKYNPPSEPDKNDKYSPKYHEGSCLHCGNKIDEKKALKTKIDAPDGFKTAHFCGFSCFEAHEEWPRNRSKKQRTQKK